MPGHNPDDNLLLRLFPYSPHHGRLEDFCTETLAWCLRNCGSFREAFLRTFNLKVSGRELPEILTQRRYEYASEDEGDEGEDDASDAGRFDLVIQYKNELLAIIEIKTGSGFGHEQLRRYRDELQRRQKSGGFRKATLITITDKAKEPEGADIHKPWSEIHRLLECEVVDKGSSDLASAICKQFAQFLKEKGLGSMNVPAITSRPVKQWIDGIKLRASLEDVLRSLKNEPELKSILGQKRAVFEEKDDTVWIGIWGNQPDFWIGFGLTDKDEPARAFMLISTTVSGKPEDEDRFKHVNPRYGGKLNPEYADNKIWLNLERNIDGELDGNGERIREWLLESAKWLLTLR